MLKSSLIANEEFNHDVTKEFFCSRILIRTINNNQHDLKSFCESYYGKVIDDPINWFIQISKYS